MKKQKFAIIDANAIIHRAFHALPPLQNKKGKLVNAVYGFATILLKVLKDIKPDYIAVCFDVDKKTFRKEMYKEYKATRKEQPQELYDQIDLVRDLARAFNMPVFEKQGFEADDVIGTINQQINKAIKQQNNKLETLIVTGDLDALQLVDENTKVYTLKKGINDTLIYDIEGIKERFGFGSEQMVDYKALRGDPSDNIPGVKGIGEKTATDLIKEFGDLNSLYDLIDEVSKENEEIRNKKLEIRNIKKSVYKKLFENKKEAFLSKDLATIRKDVEIDFELEKCRVGRFDMDEVVRLFQDWNFKTLISKIPQAEKQIMGGNQASLFDKPVGNNEVDNEREEFKIRDGYTLVDTQEKFDTFLGELIKQKQFAIDTETDGIDPFQNNLIGISFCWSEGEAYYLEVENKKLRIKNKEKSLEELKKILSDKNVGKIGHNIKFDMEVLGQAGMTLNGIACDTMIISYLLNPGGRQHSLDAATFAELGHQMVPIKSLIGVGKKQITLKEIDIEKVADYACEDADYTFRLYESLIGKLREERLEGLMDRLETPLIGVLARIEENGVKIDAQFLDKMSGELEVRINKLESSMFKIAGQKFNPRSPIQLKEILFEKLGIAAHGLSRTKTGISTAAGELDKLKGSHKIIDLIMEHRELAKLKSTYTDALPKLVNPKTGRVHTSFNQTVTATGRLSSSDPNLQNIPIRTELGAKIRNAFVADKGCKIIAADYSQVELRVAASLANDTNMIESFRNGEDIHARTAAKVCGADIDDVTKEQRTVAKRVNFGILYGQGARGLSQQAGIPYDEAVEFIEKYFEVYEDIKNYLEETIEQAREHEYVETLFERRRYVPEINAQHQQMRSSAQRMAINFPIQGTAADLLKMAMIEIDGIIQKDFGGREVRMILTVHDELVFEVKENLVDKFSKIVKDVMEGIYELKVPLKVEVGVGESWGKAK